MVRRLLLKCFVFLWVYIIRPENVFSDASYFSNGPVKRLRHDNNPPGKWALDILKDKINLVGLETTEPGFNLTKEEMIKFKIWPQGIIPYYIDDFSFDKVLRDKIRNFLDLTNTASGLRFTELPGPPDDERTRWVLFVNRQGLLSCADHSIIDFTNEGVQKVILGYDCLVTGGELAEAILALVGVPPQHNAPDRDQYIRIAKKNIIEGDQVFGLYCIHTGFEPTTGLQNNDLRMPLGQGGSNFLTWYRQFLLNLVFDHLKKKKYLFTALNDTDWLFHEVPYDFNSASHYGLHKYTKNGYATIKLVQPTNLNFEDDKGFSFNDIWKIRMLYNYISNKKRKSIKISDCMKLFEPGANFSQYKPFLDESRPPRPRPNKYLGLPEVNFTKTGNQTKSEVKLESNKDDKKMDSLASSDEDDKENGHEHDIKREPTSKEIHGQLLREDGEEDNEKVNDGKSKIKSLKKIEKLRDPFHEMSDYKSSETTKIFQRSFGKIKG